MNMFFTVIEAEHCVRIYWILKRCSTVYWIRASSYLESIFSYIHVLVPIHIIFALRRVLIFRTSTDRCMDIIKK